jgi:surfactin synthase thioesterase subunit
MSELVSVVTFTPRPRPDLVLYCFCYAGGGVGTYRRWGQALGPNIEVRAVSLPGVAPGPDGQLVPPPLVRMPSLVADLAAIVTADRRAPVALFGHSMGSLIAFELARRLRRDHGREPVHLIASAGRAPQRRGGDSAYHRLPDEPFVAAMQARWNAIPDAVAAEPELLRLLLPGLRRDVALFETYEYRAEPPLSCPIAAWGGDADPGVSHADLAAWQAETTGPFSRRTFAGGHFFVDHASAAVIAAVGDTLSAPARVAHPPAATPPP